MQRPVSVERTHIATRSEMGFLQRNGRRPDEKLAPSTSDPVLLGLALRRGPAVLARRGGVHDPYSILSGLSRSCILRSPLPLPRRFVSPFRRNSNIDTRPLGYKKNKKNKKKISLPSKSKKIKTSKPNPNTLPIHPVMNNRKILAPLAIVQPHRKGLVCVGV